MTSPSAECRMLERVLLLAGALLGLVLLTRACDSRAEDWSAGDPLPPTPHSTTKTIDGQKFDCFDTENLRLVVTYVRAIAPELALRLQGELAKAVEYQKQLANREQQVELLTTDLANYQLDLQSAADDLDSCNATVNAQAEAIEDEAAASRRRRIVHFVIHAVTISTATIFGVVAFR